jgi:membrane protein
MRRKLKNFAKILKITVKEWWNNEPFRQSAIIAYYAIFSLPALLVLIINFVGLFYKRETISGEISRQIEGLMGRDTAEQVAKIVDETGKGEAGIISGIIAVITLILGAAGVFVQLQKILNEIWGVKQKPNQGILLTLRTRLFSFGLII